MDRVTGDRRKLRRRVVGPRATSAHGPEWFWARPTALGARAVAFPRTLGEPGAGEGSRVQEVDARCVVCPRVQARGGQGAQKARQRQTLYLSVRLALVRSGELCPACVSRES